MRGKKGVFTEGTTARFGSYFDAGAMPEVLPAVTRQIVQWEQRRRRRYLSTAALFIGAFLVTLGIFVFSADFRDWAESRFLALNDPTVFQHSRDGSYKVARLLDGRSDIQDNTNFRDEIRGSRLSLDRELTYVVNQAVLRR